MSCMYVTYVRNVCMSCMYVVGNEYVCMSYTFMAYIHTYVMYVYHVCGRKPIWCIWPVKENFVMYICMYVCVCMQVIGNEYGVYSW